MATKLKNLKITKVDFVDDGANPEAHIRLFKSKDGVEPPHDEGAEKKPNIWKRLITAITKAAGSEPDTSEEFGELRRKNCRSEKPKNRR